MKVLTLALAGSILSTVPMAVAAPGAPETATTSRMKARLGQLKSFSAPGFLDSKLGKAVQEGDRKNVEKLLGDGAKANVKGSWGHSLLHIAAATSSAHPERSLEIARLLLEAGADVNAVSKSGVTPLHETVFSGSPKMAELLIKKGAIVNAPLKGSGHCLDPDHDLAHGSVFGRSKEQRTPLFFAKALKREDLVKLLKKAAQRSESTGAKRLPAKDD